MTKKEEWNYWNSILNIARKMTDKKEFSKEYNLYLHSKHEKATVINSDVLRNAIKLKYGGITAFIEDEKLSSNVVYSALGGKPLTKNALNRILMLAKVPYKDIEIKGVV